MSLHLPALFSHLSTLPRLETILVSASNRSAFHSASPLFYQRRADHIPNTQIEEETTYLLALHTDSAHHETMTALRKRFFPTHLNKLDAHVALFRALPGSKLDQVVNDLRILISTTTTFPIKTTSTFRLSKGVAVNIDDGGQSQAMYRTLKHAWNGFLSKQDQSYQPHYTIANKLHSVAEVQTCLDAMQTEFLGSEGRVEGLSLFRYDQGFWKDEKVFSLQQNNIDD